MKDVAYCGLCCTDCMFYKSDITKQAEELIHSLRIANFKDYAEIKRKQADAREEVSPFHFYSRFIEMLTWVSKRGCVQSCREGADNCGLGKDCKIRQCVLSKQYEGCWECSLLDSCTNFSLLRAVCHNAPQNNSKYIKDIGMYPFLTSEDRQFYRWNDEK